MALPKVGAHVNAKYLFPRSSSADQFCRRDHLKGNDWASTQHVNIIERGALERMHVPQNVHGIFEPYENMPECVQEGKNTKER